jgi:hypothetical protein
VLRITGGLPSGFDMITALARASARTPTPVCKPLAEAEATESGHVSAPNETDGMINLELHDRNHFALAMRYTHDIVVTYQLGIAGLIANARKALGVATGGPGGGLGMLSGLQGLPGLCSMGQRRFYLPPRSPRPTA